MAFTAETLAKHISQVFTEPFIEGVECTVRENGDFILKIGRRDLQITSGGEWVGQGTRLVAKQE